MNVAGVVAHATPGHPAADVVVTVRNPYPVPIWFESPDAGIGSETPKEVASGGSAELRVPILVTDCSQSGPPVAWTEDEDTGAWSFTARVDLEPLDAARGRGMDDPHAVQLTVRADLAARLERQLRSTCRGAPALRATIAGVSRSNHGSELGWDIDMRLSVRVDQVAFGAGEIDPEDPIDRADDLEDDPWLRLSPPVPVSNGVARATLEWAVDLHLRK